MEVNHSKRKLKNKHGHVHSRIRNNNTWGCQQIKFIIVSYDMIHFQVKEEEDCPHVRGSKGEREGEREKEEVAKY